MKFLALLVLACGVLASAQDQTAMPPLINLNKALVDALVRRGDLLVTQVNSKITTYRSANNYFVRAIEDELRVLTTVLADLKEEATKAEATINVAFLLQAELQVTRHENILAEMFQLAERAKGDVKYAQLLELIDALLARAYQDIGFLIVHKQEGEVKVIEGEIAKIEDLKTKLLSLDYAKSPEEVQKTVEVLLEHERIIEEELYRIEKMKNVSPDHP